jgi:hypothetical protein
MKKYNFDENNKRRRIAGFIKFKEKIMFFKGELLEKQYLGYKVKHKVSCFSKHIFYITPTSILFGGRSRTGTWCPHCKKSTGEKIVHNYLEYIFNKQFSKVRPIWLINDSKNRLELDLYNEELKLAVEYQGYQHYTKTFFQTDDQFEKLKEHDKIKEITCKEKGINLIKIKDEMNKDKIWKNLLSQLIKYGYLVDKILKPKLIIIPDNLFYLERIKNICFKRGGACLSDNYISMKTKVNVVCSNGHQWSITPSNLCCGK